MLKYLKRRKYRKQVLDSLYAVLYPYPRGRDNIIKDYPRIRDLIKSNFADGGTPQRAALLAAAPILAKLIGTLSADQRALIDQQLQQIDVRQARELMRDLRGGKPLPKEIAFGTVLLGNAITTAQTLVDRREVDQADYDTFVSEAFGALSGTSSRAWSSEPIVAGLDLAMSLPKLIGQDEGPLLPRPLGAFELPPLSGTEVQVKLVSTPAGILLVSEEDGRQITERQRLSQQDLQTVPSELGVYRFVNLRARSGEICSCIIAGEDAQVIGSMRAFWWSLAKLNVWMVDASARMTRMTATALADVHAAAIAMWDAAIRGAHTIDNMRNLTMPVREAYLETINKLRIETTSDSKRLGLDIALAMVLATQSEDARLEAHAYQRFKQFLWRPGEEPAEFREYENA
jgi:hypothetical protein